MTNTLAPSFHIMPSSTFQRKRRHEESVDPVFFPSNNQVPTPPETPLTFVSDRHESNAVSSTCYASLNTTDNAKSTSVLPSTPSTPGNLSTSSPTCGESPFYAKKKSIPSVFESHKTQTFIREMLKTSQSLNSKANSLDKSKDINSIETKHPLPTPNIATLSPLTDKKPQEKSYDYADHEVYSDDDGIDHILPRALYLTSRIKVKTIDSYFPKIGVSKDVAKAAMQDADEALSDVEDIDSDLELGDDEHLQNNSIGETDNSDADFNQNITNFITSDYDDDGDLDMMIVDRNIPTSTTRRSSCCSSQVESLDMDSCFQNGLDYSRRPIAKSNSSSSSFSASTCSKSVLSHPLATSTKIDREGKKVTFNHPPYYFSFPPPPPPSIPNSALFNCTVCLSSIPNSSSSTNLIDHIRNHQCKSCSQTACDSCIVRNVKKEGCQVVELECVECLRKRF